MRRVYVYRLDRLTRSGIRDTFEVVEELRQVGAELVKVADGFTLEGPAADVILAVMAWAAGGTWGRPPSMGASQVERARALKEKGKSLRAIAATLGASKDAVWRALAAG